MAQGFLDSLLNFLIPPAIVIGMLVWLGYLFKPMFHGLKLDELWEKIKGHKPQTANTQTITYE